ncbi:Pentatricopeptide repeat-containing protein At5g66520 [Linum perenne]
MPLLLWRLLKPIKSPLRHRRFVTGKSFFGDPRSPASIIKQASSPREALGFYCEFHRQSSSELDSYSLLFALKSAGRLDDARIVRHFHAHGIRLGYITNVYVATCLLSAYVATSFRDAHHLFDGMPDRNRTAVTWNVMITGYARSGDVDKARQVFDEMPQRNVESWSAMITAYARSGYSTKGLSLFREMISAPAVLIKPDEVTIGTVLFCCVQIGSPGSLHGRSIHCFLLKNALEMNVEIGTVLVDMYAKCGFLNYACLVFDSMKERNVTTWTTLICAAAHNGYSQEALSLFEMMKEEGVQPNEMTFTGILHACAFNGLVEQGRRCFEMIKEYGLEYRIQHYGCMVDLYGKAGLVEEAYGVIMTMELEPSAVVWGSFLSACKEHDRFDMAEKVMELVLRAVKPESDGGIYCQVCDLYVRNRRWEDAERVRKLMSDRNVRKVRGSSFVRSKD